MSEEQNSASKSWQAKGVRARVPEQAGIEVEINEKPYGDPGSTSDFTVIRHLVNFEVVDKKTKNPVESFSPPMRLTVCYTQDDVDGAGDVNKLKLAAWDGKKWRNLPITCIGRDDCPCPFTGAGFVGAAEVLITARWADPPVAWGT
jgi:hypothetical protein